MKNTEKQIVIYQTEDKSRMESTASSQLNDFHLRDADDFTAVCEEADASRKDTSRKFISPYFDKHDYEHLRWATCLPHWHQDDKHVFVTFRLADSLPQVKLRDLQEKKSIWLKGHPKPWDVEVEKEYYDKFALTIDRWLDANYGECLLKLPQNRKITEDALLYFDGERYYLKAFVVMPNHVHLLMQMKEGFNLEKVMYSLKSFTAKQINKVMHRTGRLWQSEYFDRIIRSEEHYKHVLKYIVSNNRELAKIIDDSIPYCFDATVSPLMESTASSQL